MASRITRSCDPNQSVGILFRNPVPLKINDSSVIFLSGSRQHLRFETCVLSTHHDTITLRNRSGGVPTVIESPQSIGTVKLSFCNNGLFQEETISSVQQILVTDCAITLACSKPTPIPPQPIPHPPTPDPIPHPPTPDPVDPSGPRNPQLQKENEDLKRELDQAKKSMKKLESSVNALKKENTQLRTENTNLNRAVEAGIDQTIADVQTGNLSVSQELQQKLGELNRLRHQASSLETQRNQAENDILQEQAKIDEATARHQALQEQLAALRGQAELTALDCDRAEEELNALRTRLQLNSDIVQLTESRWLKNNSVGDTLEELEKKMSAVEDRIGFILKAREIYGNAVQNAVMRDGDGAVSANDESGSPSPAPEQESGSADPAN